jgi:APA family basic amino acid/polyamine antiporter
VPLAIIAGVGAVVALYLLVNWAYLHLLGYAGVTGSAALAADAVARVSPGAGSRIIAGAVAISALGVLNAQLLSGPRLIQAMAADGRFFAPLALVSRRFGTPAFAIWLLAALAAVVLAGGGGIANLLNGVIFIDGIFLGLTGAAIFRLKRPRLPAVALLFVLGEASVVAGAVIGAGRIGAAAGAAWIAAAALFYAIFFARR